MTKSNKHRLTILTSEQLLDRAKNTVYWTPGLTLASLAEEGLRLIVERFEKERGALFPHRKEELKSGRPMI